MQSVVAFLAKPRFRQAAKNFGWLLTERAVRFGLGTVVGFVIARHLGPVRLGSLSYCLAVITLLQCFAAFGVDAVIKRDLLQTPERTGQLLADAFMLRLLAGLAAALGLLIFMATGPTLAAGEGTVLFILSALLWQPSWVVPELWLQARLQARYSVLAQTAALAVSAGIRIWLVTVDASLAAFAAVNLLEGMLAGVGLHLAARHAGLRINWFAARRDSMGQLVREAGPLVMAGLAIIVYMKIDEIMLRQMAGAEAVGIYSAATRLTEIWFFLPIALGSSLLPALVRARAEGAAVYQQHLQRYYDLNAAVAYAFSIPVALTAPWLVRLAYGEPFAGSAAIVAVHIWSSVFVFLGVARGQWLINERLSGFYLAATMAGAVVNILLNLYLIPRWAGLGAAYATVVSYALAAWISSYFHPAVRGTAAMQTRALLIPFTGWRYLRR